MVNIDAKMTSKFFQLSKYIEKAKQNFECVNLKNKTILIVTFHSITRSGHLLDILKLVLLHSNSMSVSLATNPIFQELG